MAGGSPLGPSVAPPVKTSTAHGLTLIWLEVSRNGLQQQTSGPHCLLMKSNIFICGPTLSPTRPRSDFLILLQNPITLMFRYFVLNGRGHLSILVSTSISWLCNYLLRTLVQSITHFPLSEKTRSTLFGIVYPHSSRFWCDHGHHLGISVLIPINSSAEFSTKHLPTTLILQIWIESHRNFIDHLLRDPKSICKGPL